MRAHGVSNFPDPSATGGFPRGSVAGSGSPAFQTAQKSCIPILKAGGSGHAPSLAQREAMLTFARCMRAHRVPTFPDPVTPGQVPKNVNVLVDGGLLFPVGSLDVGSPAFRQASAACGLGSPGGQPQGG
jgi:hypothetical protein